MKKLGATFWIVAAIDAALLLVFLAMTLQQHSPGGNDGGREMGLFFFIIVPACVLAIAMLMFHFSASPWVKGLALFIVLVPGVWFAQSRVRDVLIDRSIEADRTGAGYFESEAMRRMGVAVVQRDVATLMRLGPTVDVNAAGRDMTLLALAVRSADARTSDGSEMPVVRALLALGARTDSAMHVACVRSDSVLLEALLAAGGNPNLRIGDGEPLVFDTMSSITPDNFRRLARSGLDLNSKSRDGPLPVQLAIYRRWDLLAIAIELGADMSAKRPDGRHVAGELAGQADEETKAGREVPAALQHARDVLSVASLNPRSSHPKMPAGS